VRLGASGWTDADTSSSRLQQASPATAPATTSRCRRPPTRCRWRMRWRQFAQPIGIHVFHSGSRNIGGSDSATGFGVSRRISGKLRRRVSCSRRLSRAAHFFCHALRLSIAVQPPQLTRQSGAKNSIRQTGILKRIDQPQQAAIAAQCNACQQGFSKIVQPLKSLRINTRLPGCSSGFRAVSAAFKLPGLGAPDFWVAPPPALRAPATHRLRALAAERCAARRCCR